MKLDRIDVEKVAQAIEADAGQKVPGLRESLAEAKVIVSGMRHSSQRGLIVPTPAEDAAIEAGIALDPATQDLSTPSELAFTAEQATLAAVRPLAGLVLELTYADGATLQVDVAPIVERAPVLRPLLDPTVFAQAQVGEWGACVTWGTDVLELAADNLRARAAGYGRAAPTA